MHSKLRMDSPAMTRRMVTAVSNPHVDVLGHCTGRLVRGARGTRPESQFDADLVFEACRQFGVAVEINSRPERRDPPTRLLQPGRRTRAACSRSTPMPTPPGSWTSSITAAPEPNNSHSPPTRSSTPCPSTHYWNGRPGYSMQTSTPARHAGR